MVNAPMLAVFAIIMSTPAWHAETSERVLAILEGNAHGLSPEAAAQRLNATGSNRLPAIRARGFWAKLLAQFNNLLIYVLIASAVISLVLGHLSDALVILAVVVLNALIGYIQEGRAEKALDTIKHIIDPHAVVLRGGRRLTVPAESIVCGDVVLLEAGDRVPADLRLLRVRNLALDEAILTGESLPVVKSVEAVAADAAIADRRSLAFSGTFVTAGTGRGVVVATGAATELGKISALLGGVAALRTPLLTQMDRLAAQLTLVTLAIGALAFAFAFFVRHYPIDEAFMIVVGLAVAVIPEGLPAILTITLAIGVRRMAGRHAIIRRLPAVETLGAVSVICSDKTGTLTRNEMMVQNVVVAGRRWQVTGTGYEPLGVLSSATATAVEHPALVPLAQAAALCNDAELRRRDDGWLPDGDPMEAALLALAAKAGADAAALRHGFPRLDEIPFDAEHRFMATLHRGRNNERRIFVKGAPERILAMASRELRAEGEAAIDRDFWRQAGDDLARSGQRVLALARRELTPEHDELRLSDLEEGLTLLGLVGLIDPPRAEAVAAIAECRRAGIRVMMITGDHAVTAGEIARQLGLAEHPVTVTGREIDTADDTTLQRYVATASVFARTSPEQKLRLVSALQAQGLTVAMTGDGVNDAPALKRADVGVAMGRKGTEVAKEASGMVLADDNFASIVAAVREGRTVYDNIVKVIGWTLPTNGGEALTIMAALALGLTLPVTAIQLLWINMVTAVALGLTLAFEPTEPRAMERSPRPRNTPILTLDLAWRVIFVSLLFVAGAFGILAWADMRGLSLETARTLVVNTIVVFEIVYLFSVRYVHGPSITLEGMLGTRAVWLGVAIVALAQLAFTYAPFMNAVFESAPVSLADGALVIALGIAVLIVVEIEKTLRAKLKPGRANAA
jgi:calcium-translocating P-type ATPase